MARPRLRSFLSRPTDLDDLESRLVWILGGPRTGSTWLLELLSYPLRPDTNSRSGAARWPQSGSDSPHAMPINEPFVGLHLSPVLFAEVDAVATAADSRAGDPSYFFDERYSDAWRPRLREMILERFGAQERTALEEHGLTRPTIFLKEPNGSQAAPILLSTLPRSRLLFLLRDGRDVLDSQLDAVSPGGWLAHLGGGMDSAGQRNHFLRTNAASWVHRVGAVQQAADAHPPGLTKTVRYEDLRADTAAVLRDIAGWLKLDVAEATIKDAMAALSFEAYPAEAKGRGKALRVASPGHWRESMSPDEQTLMAEIMGSRLEEMGYRV